VYVFFRNSELTMPKVKKKSVAQKLREEKERKRKQQVANTAARRLTRQDQARRDQEQVADTNSRRLARQDTVVRSVERKRFWEAEKKRRLTAKSSYEKLKDKYIDQIRQSPSCICSCCGGIWYEKSTTATSQEALILCGCDQDFIDTVLRVQQNEHRLCGTCKKSITQKRVPRLCLSNGFDFPIVPSELKVLSLSQFT
jgi:hypothetical protein